ncbi:dihydrolipoamide acetyltransferase family protein [Tessaracoccus flavus]|uniref:Dihydrolipoamide acetyltransferase component of pyruvate dehydrogenase complex n=1 Tax=Tessaracoccus flavus TaxID=1610493 RepID=A0A1Q2CGV3_9ACTN|nr:dihydrolipoamide acetyltransferase family protein [Tessaracoccus flavus]AQP45334.1 acetoin dehydrogenase [Tessaracoccus flavus]SDY48446.1 pyruvate dehydrogenase E2 component (dihydrolipoamide acetyltransferase) [Tessaracoccus flavus]
MATVVVMPQLGNSVESCLIVSWLVAVGDAVAENAIVCEVETDKASMEVPSTAAGTVLALLWDEGDDVPVKEPLLVVGAAGEDPKAALAEIGWSGAGDDGSARSTEEPAAVDDEPSAPAADDAPRTAATGASSPRARALAQANSLDIASVSEGSGPGGRVIERDVRAALSNSTAAAARAGAHGSDAAGTGIGGRITTGDLAAPTEPAAEATPATAAASGREYPGPSTATPLKGVRKVIAERMMHSLASSAQLTYTTTARAAGLLALRAKLKGSPEELGLNGVTIGDLVGFAAIKTAAKHTNHNAHLADGTLTTFENVHLGMAVDTPRGLLVPTVRNANQMSLREFSATSKELAFAAIDGRIDPDLLAGATFTVSNLGGFGIESFTPLLNVPQVAILGVDAIFPRAVIHDDGTVGAEQRIGFSLTADHRVIDGADAARFLQDLVKYVENIDITVLG